MLQHGQSVEVILRQDAEGVTASLLGKADCVWCFCFLGFSICTASDCLVGFRGWNSLFWWADQDRHDRQKSLPHLIKHMTIDCCSSRSIFSLHKGGLTIPACLRSFMLSLIPALPSGMLYYFDYNFDHRETKLKELPLGCSYRGNPYLMLQWVFFLGISLATLYSRTEELTTAWVWGATGLHGK